MKNKFFIKDFFSKCYQIRKKLRIWSHLLKNSLTKTSFFGAVSTKIYLCGSHICSNHSIYESLTVIPEFNFQQFLFGEYYIILYFVLTY